MSMRDLVEGDCGGPNPLIRLTSHFVKDHGLKEEGVREECGPSNNQFVDVNEEHYAHAFLDEPAAMHPQTFRMESLLQEIQDLDKQPENLTQPPKNTSQDPTWANQYLESGSNFQLYNTDNIWNTYSSVPELVSQTFSDTNELGFGPEWAKGYLGDVGPNARSIEQSFMNRAAAQSFMDPSNFHPPIEIVNNQQQGMTSNPDLAYSKFIKFMRQEGDLPLSEAEARVQEWTKELKEENEPKLMSKDSEKILSDVDEQNAVAGSWVEEFEKKNLFPPDDLETPEFWANFRKEWEKSEKEFSGIPWSTDSDTFYDPFKEYTFSEDNPMQSIPNPLEEGKRRLAEGDLPGAVLCFEACVKQEPENGEAWLLLGKTQAENEQDPLAIAALKKCLAIEPDNLTALLTLAVSYTNESYQIQACLTLKDWLLKNEKYKHLKSLKPSQRPSQPDVTTIMFSDERDEVKDLYLQAARMQPHGTIDPDVQCGLGVLLNLANEYDKAADCFRAAIQARPEDPKLWNRLGAILANGQRSEEAIDAYHKALELSPGFIRARYNLGIACINLHVYKEAGEHLLTALNQQAAAKGASGERAPTRVMSDTIWSTLRLVCSLMHKYDALKAIEDRDLETLNKEFQMDEFQVNEG
ncbi:peroxisomal targeting signal 1 receptor [Trichogramma pretiosum]|uniref:peroxisomal targeting signal 1 receptor n=1 Tax=Trichogramma pretiosum TaxID=7493 RepID=UPI0006C98FDE|nr:peroxisomal targeting signal 1 receptor [Trichogramma pretiosum]XP_014237058.1 peroxisomal targeting signal 1 receptor [Trichogramma pretiosum]XP_014237059.1 peroxisomal targeting signal 1 receptor [Trichogramma pretiosum]XP_014237060.1 peroxisomal targeting signal 1 receptor [Trichogramma pretiosum]